MLRMNSWKFRYDSQRKMLHFIWFQKCSSPWNRGAASDDEGQPDPHATTTKIRVLFIYWICVSHSMYRAGRKKGRMRRVMFQQDHGRVLSLGANVAVRVSYGVYLRLSLLQTSYWADFSHSSLPASLFSPLCFTWDICVFQKVAKCWGLQRVE